jgi:tetratricopeptide (TPR) repeat protein
MKIILIIFLAFFTSAAITRLRSVKELPTDSQKSLSNFKQKNIISCSPNLSKINFNDSTQDVPLLPGWGNYKMKVSTLNDSAEIYFNQGINLYYGFHIIEALASFQKATQLDTGFAMAYWGKALAYGPNINDFGYTASPEAIIAMKKARELSNSCSSVEKSLIDAMQVRYSTDTLQSREQLNQVYATEMKKISGQFPKNADVAALYVDALMQQHPWDLYTKNYQPKPWTTEIVKTLERLLKAFPDHPGAAHYYIHAIEASAHPEKGLKVANKLPKLMPGVAHVVHMPSHIYVRSGYYDQGVKVNKQAVTGYYNYLSKFPLSGNNSPLYLVHNLHMQATCANMNGQFNESVKASNACRKSFDSTWQDIPDFNGIYIQYLYMTPFLTLIRFGKWDEILRAPAIPEKHIYAHLLWQYGKGLAYARKHDFTNALKQLRAVTENLKAGQLKSPAPSYANPGIAGAEVAQKILQGVIAEEQNQLDEAAGFLKKAVVLEDSMIYNEPKDWVHPARQYYGNVLLKAKRFNEAITVFEEDLKINPNNGWSLTGLTMAFSGKGQTNKAKETKRKANKAFSQTDVKILASVY